MGTGPVLAWTIPAQAGETARADGTMTYTFLNKTKEKFPDQRVYWSLDGKEFKSMAQAGTATVGKKPGGRVYFSLGAPMKDLAGHGVCFDFMPSSGTTTASTAGPTVSATTT
jgi:hypothetical protein